MCKSCIGCKWLYSHDSGYSNWTVMEVFVLCALDKNPNLPQEIDGIPSSGWNMNQENDNFPATRNGKCDSYSPINIEDGDSMIMLDIDGEVTSKDFTSDLEVINVIDKHAGRS